MTTAVSNPTTHADPTEPHPHAHVPVWQPDARAEDFTDAERDYLFDLRGFDIIRGALTPKQLAAINAFVDANDPEQLDPGQWIGHVETHRYDLTARDGLNFQNVIEAGPAFEQCIDHPAWVDRVQRYIAHGQHRVVIDENFLNVRAAGSYIPIHSGGASIRFTSCFRNHAGHWMVGQINILMALTDTGPGDGCTTVVPGSHKAHEEHPANADGNAWGAGRSGADAVGMVQVHLKAGDALMFTDAITHGSLPRINPGHRRVMIYRYAPHLLANRFNYIPSDELLERVTDRQRQMIQPQPPRLRPDRTITGVSDTGPRDVIDKRD
ncbi:MAG: phytanoyl-CoA dioxygenase family protein [Planctomycetota bacterium]